MKALGRFYGVGVGPGDPELLTLRALKVLRRVPVVCVPKRSPDADSYAYSIVRGILDAQRQEIVELVFPMRKDLSQVVAYWEQNLAAIVRRLEGGQDCAFITEGDPFLYSTFIYMYDILRQRHPQVRIEVIPGVSSFTAAAARAGLPLVNGDERLAVLPATCESQKLKDALREFDAVVLMKVNSVFDRVLDLLEELNLTDKAVYIKKGTAADEEIVRDIRQLRGRKLEYLSLLIVRK